MAIIAGGEQGSRGQCDSSNQGVAQVNRCALRLALGCQLCGLQGRPTIQAGDSSWHQFVEKVVKPLLQPLTPRSCRPNVAMSWNRSK